ncbi:MAG: amidohydrolase family protein [Candidatus Cloacimonetes bacterium]|nr:amidohydrolase family protein [Candidatus Cloacimonadota bacterium]NLO43796.1 amidohydrolase family protein [Candidatus Cloacimonadota bacterium]
MILHTTQVVIDSKSTHKNLPLNLHTTTKDLSLDNSVAYCPLINAHDHLIGNWYPKAGKDKPYPNSHIWVEDMKQSASFLERNKFWFNDGSFNLLVPEAHALGRLGAYKNLFSGCSAVHDHGPNQLPKYYQAMPINVIEAYRQCHSITLGNWWGGESPEREMELAGGKMPFIIHLGEGTDEVTKQEFAELERRGLLKENTLLIHGIAFTKEEIVRIAKAGASVCWCQNSNAYLIGETFDIDSALQVGANVVIGTDSTMSGGINLIAELREIHEKYPHIPLNTLFRMVTENSAKALYLSEDYGKLNPDRCRNLLVLDRKKEDPFENILELNAASIKLLVVEDIPRFGDRDLLDYFPKSEREYTFFDIAGREKFVIGDPLAISNEIDSVLGYHKDFPFLPF